MKKEYEVTLAKFYTNCRNYYEVCDDIAIEDVRFIKFTDLLEAANIFKNVKFCRYEGLGIRNSKWNLLGYSFTNDIISDDEDDDNDDDSNNNRVYEWNFTFFNGFFSGDNIIVNSKRSDILKSVSDTVKFIEATLSRNSKYFIKDIHPISELQQHLCELDKKKLLDKIDICIITDNIIDHENLDSSFYIESIQKEIKIHYWGINKWAELLRSKSKRLPININLIESGKLNYDVLALEHFTENDNVKYYLSIFPGDLIADLYDEFDTQLLENNVRVFLSLKSKYNSAMSKTISSNDKQMFFAYNNGLSATASKIKINPTNNRIEAIEDFQIVNGGQTTATLYHTKKHLKKSLSDIFVQVKITVLNKSDNYSILIGNISKYANSQTAIKSSDFWTNDSYLIEFEKLSLRNPIQLNGNYVNYFFERMVGQYKETRSRKGTKRDILSWEKQNPKKYCFNKIDLARWFNAIDLHPHIAVSSAEKQFEIFMKRKIKPILTDLKYKTIVGFGQLCDRARKVTGKASSKEFPPIIDDSNVGMATSIYAMSYFHYISYGKFDYHQVFNKEIEIQELDEILKHIIKKCWDQIYEYDQVYTRDKTKTEGCWLYVKENVKLNTRIINMLNRYLITDEEYLKRESIPISEEEFYFRSLNILMSNNSKLLFDLQDIATSNKEFYKQRSLLKNFIHRINMKSEVIVLSKVKEIFYFIDELKDYNLITKSKVKPSVDFIRIYDKIYSSRNDYFLEIENYIESKTGDDFDKYITLYEEQKKLIEDYDIYPGLSLNDMKRIEEIIDLFGA
jgi:hypothetical protein